MKRREVALVLAIVFVAGGLALWQSRTGLAAEVRRHGGEVVDEAETPEGPTVSVVFTARPFGDDDLHCLRGRRGFQRLLLDSTHVTGAGLADLEGMNELRWLSLPGCPVTDDGLKNLPPLPSLEILILDRTRVTDAGLVYVGKQTSLQHLHLSETAVSDAGLEHLRGLKQLAELRATRSRVTEGGIHALQAALPKLTRVAVGDPRD